MLNRYRRSWFDFKSSRGRTFEATTHNKKRRASPDALRTRTFVVCVVLALWMCAVGARLIYLQISKAEFFQAEAARQHQGGAAQNSERGLILDCRGRELARSLKVASVFAEPHHVVDVAQTARLLATVLHEDEKVLAARLTKAKTDGKKFVWLKRKLDASVAKTIASLKLKGVGTRDEEKRFYPNDELAAHVIGFVGLDEKGLGGVELTQNARLEGEAGKRFFHRDRRSKPYESWHVAARDGGSIVLTIDAVIQHQAEQILTAAVANSKARAGTAIVLDPQSGEILALANAPSFNPNVALEAAMNADANIEANDEKIKLRAASLRRNEALQNIYEPGSTFKIVAYAAAIEEGLARPDDKIDCQNGGITIAGRTIRDHHAYATLSLTDALAKSSNVAAIKLGLRLGNQRLYKYAREFGFGGKTGVDLPGETAGLLRPVSRWQASSIGSIAIGQEVGTTPLQVVSAFATLANNGVRIAPHIVKGVRAPDGAFIEAVKREQTAVVSPPTAEALRAMLESVTVRGTAKKAQLDGYTAAGKTGTAQKIDPATRRYSATKYVASFAGFAPIKNPRVAIIVVLDEPKGEYHGGTAAAPVFRDIASVVLPYLNVMPDAEFTDAPSNNLDVQLATDRSDRANIVAVWQKNQSPDNAFETPEAPAPPQIETREDGRVIYTTATEKGLRMPDLRGASVRDAWTMCAQLGLQMEARGHGRATAQYPAAGASVDAGETVRVTFDD